MVGRDAFGQTQRDKTKRRRTNDNAHWGKMIPGTEEKAGRTCWECEDSPRMAGSIANDGSMGNAEASEGEKDDGDDGT